MIDPRLPAAFAAPSRKTRRFLAIFLFPMLAVAALSACGEAPEEVQPRNAAKDGLTVSVVYQSGNDIHVIHRGESPRVVLKGASYPRFSPDAERVVAVRGREIVVVPSRGGASRVIATAESPRAVAWSDSGDRVFYSDGDRVMVVNADGGRVRAAWSGQRVLELDAGPDDRLVGTVKGFGYAIFLFDPGVGEAHRLASGCSASFSPDGRLVSNLLDGHRSMAFLPARPGVESRKIKAPDGIQYDNHMWTNHPDWIAGELEGDRRDIILINTRDGRVRRVTEDGNASRGDVFIHDD